MLTDHTHGVGRLPSTEASYEKTEGSNQNLSQIVNSETPENSELGVGELEDELRPARCGQARRRSLAFYICLPSFRHISPLDRWMIDKATVFVVWSQPVPYRELPPRRKVIWIWVCVRLEQPEPISLLKPSTNTSRVLLWKWRDESVRGSLSILRNSSLSELWYTTIQYALRAKSSCSILHLLRDR